MEGRKTKFRTVKGILYYLIFAVVIVGCVLAYNYKEQIATFFASDLTGIVLLDKLLHYVPKLIYSFQIIVVATIVNKIIGLISKAGFGITDKGKTLVKLFTNLLSWVVIFVTIFVVLSFWGIDSTKLFASASVITLIIGLGAQSLISDVIAGIFIIIEGEYIVGDIVVIDGWRGKIKSIGIRTTQIEDIGGNIKIVNNSEIKTVINRTKKQSMAICYVSVALSEQLAEVERVVNENLKDVRKKIPAITEDIKYRGVANTDHICMELMYTARCYEEDLFQVQRDMNREFKLLLDAYNILNYDPQVTVAKIEKVENIQNESV